MRFKIRHSSMCLHDNGKDHCHSVELKCTCRTFDWDNYIDYYYKHNQRYSINESFYPRYVYKRPKGCAPGDGSTRACCG